MSGVSLNPSDYADFSGLESLRKSAKAADPKAVRAAAQQFESLFTEMMLKSMRAAKLGDDMGESDATDYYTQMFDQRLAIQMSQGKGLGLADMLVQQLTRSGLVPAQAGSTDAASGNTAASSGTGTGSSTPSASAAGATGATGTASRVTARAGTAAAATDGASAAQRSHFVRCMAPYAETAASALGVSSDALIAQAALETGWGRHLPGTDGTSSGNLFGIKAGAGWSGATVQAVTTEYQGGSSSALQQPFRAYATTRDSVQDYVSLLQNSPRYAAALNTGSDTVAFATALQRGGYATDPDYAQKLQATTASVRAVRAADATALKLVAGRPITDGGEPA